MESKLMQYADQMPYPKRGFPQAEKSRHRVFTPRRGMKLAALVLLLCLTVTACTRAAKNYGLWSGLQSGGYGDVEIWNRKYGYIFPESLWNLSFTNMSIYYGAPQGATHLEAMLAPTYALHNVDYGDYQGKIGQDGIVEWVGKSVYVSYGTTENENWKYHFSVAEDGSCNHADVLPGSQRSLEYKGYTLYLYTVGWPSVRWEVPEKHLVIDITLCGEEYDGEVVDIAKDLIDRNEE